MATKPCLRVLSMAVLLGCSSPLPAPEPAKEGRASLAVAYQQIHMGMPEAELFALMAPYTEEFTEHAQWRSWTDGHIVVAVTITPAGGFFEEGPVRVQDKELFRKVFDGQQIQLIPVDPTHLCWRPHKPAARKTPP